MVLTQDPPSAHGSNPTIPQRSAGDLWPTQTAGRASISAGRERSRFSAAYGVPAQGRAAPDVRRQAGRSILKSSAPVRQRIYRLGKQLAIVAIFGRKRIGARSNDGLPSPFCRDPSIMRLPIPLTDGGFYFGQSRATAARNRLRSSKN